MAYNTIRTQGPSNVDSLLATTREAILNMGEYLNDQIFTKVPLFNHLRKAAQTTKQGGASIMIPLLFGKNSTVAAYSGDDTIDTTGTEGMTMAGATWRNYAGTVTATGHEIRQNAGEKLFDLIKGKTEQTMMSFVDRLDIDLFASSQAAKKIHALPVLVDASSTVQDINSSSNSWWQSQVVASGAFPVRGKADMRNLRDLISQQGQKGASAVDYIITTRLVYELYEASLEPSIRYVQREAADATFGSLKFSTASIDFDPNCATGEMYMLPTSNLKLVVHADANMSMGEFKEPTDQDVRTAKIIWMGNLVTNNRRRLGKLTGITA